MNAYLDVYSDSLLKAGEELCGDAAKVLRNTDSWILVLSDGLGSGVKANILATLTTQILATMLREQVELPHVIETALATLPLCSERNLAYATFTAVQVDQKTWTARISNFDNPDVLLFRKGKRFDMPLTRKVVHGRTISFAEVALESGDFLAIASDGVLHAGPGFGVDPHWGTNEFASCIENIFRVRPGNSRRVVQDALRITSRRYAGTIRDDATLVGAYLRPRNSTIVFTGPPLDESQDEVYAERVLNFPGRKIVCGGTTSQIIGAYAGERVKTDPWTASKDVPAAGFLVCVDLVTEGILTMARALEHLRVSKGHRAQLPAGHDAAALLARELLDADSIHFLVGQTMNPYYQNPQLPRSMSIRRNLVEQIAQFLRSTNRDVEIEFC